MKENGRAAAPGPARGTLAWWSDHSHLYVLPTAGAVSIVLGLSFTIGAWSLSEPYVPLALVLVGVGVLGTALAHLGAQRAAVPATPPPSDRYIADSLVICPSCSARSFEAVSPPQPAMTAAAWRIPDPSHTPVAGLAADLSKARPGDFLWGSWMHEAGRLPVELVGPVPETAYSPHRPGAPVFHEEGEPVVLGTATSGLQLVMGGAYSGGESPTDYSPSVTVLATDVETDLPTGIAGWKGVASSVVECSIADLVLQEALNPTPPHLRAGTRPVRAPVPGPTAPLGSPAPAAQCADCRDLVPDPANWRRCSDCHHLLCAGCMVSALLTRERAWCARCAERRHLDAL